LCCSAKASEAVAQVNGYVEENTMHKIKDLLSTSDVGPDTKLILVNAVYFKGEWRKQFDKHDTQDANFHVSPSETVKVPLMYERDMYVGYGTSAELNCQVVELPYVGDKLSMVIILPDKDKSNIHELEKKLTFNHVMNVEEVFHLREQDVNIWLPRFKLETKFQLNSALATLGMVDIFEPRKADLSGIDGSKSLVVSKVLHKTFLDVNEAGTEAAAATAISICLMCLKMGPQINFRADHPFIFFLRDKSTKSMLFIGRFAKP